MAERARAAPHARSSDRSPRRPAKLGAAGAVEALSALAHSGRLEIFKLLVRAGEEGLPAGKIARATGSLPNTLSANLNILSGAGLIGSHREGRSIIYAADFEHMRELIAYLMEDCCGGNREICMPLIKIAERACC